MESKLGVFYTSFTEKKAVEEKFNPDITECFRNPNWENSKHPLLHQFRKYYPSKEEYNSLYATPDHHILTESFKIKNKMI